MYLKTVSGDVIFEGYFHTVKRALEHAVREGVCLEYVNLRGVSLIGVDLDGAQMGGACLWGANLTRANLCGANLENVDCRNAILNDCCLAEADCKNANFQGSYLSRTILRGANLTGTKFSCPSFFNNDLSEIKTLDRAVYYHKGEEECDLSRVPITVQGLSQRVVIMKNKMLIGNSLHDFPNREDVFLFFVRLIAQEKSLTI